MQCALVGLGEAVATLVTSSWHCTDPPRIHHCLNSLQAGGMASETLTWTLAWTKGWKDFVYVLILHSCIGIDGPGWNAIPNDYQQQTSRVKMEKEVLLHFNNCPSSVCYPCYTSENPLSSLKWSLDWQLVPQCRRSQKVSQPRNVLTGKWRAVAAVAQMVAAVSCRTLSVATCRHLQCRSSVTPSPAECRQVSPERPGGLEPAAASVLEPAGRRRLGTGTCD